MITIERQVQKIRRGKWAELEKLNKQFDAVESRFGFPPKKRYRCWVGGQDMDTLIVEREWESMAAMEAAYSEVMADPEWQALHVGDHPVIESVQVELYQPLP